MFLFLLLLLWIYHCLFPGFEKSVKHTLCSNMDVHPIRGLKYSALITAICSGVADVKFRLGSRRLNKGFGTP
jgi:hypothetical protein